MKRNERRICNDGGRVMLCGVLFIIYYLFDEGTTCSATVSRNSDAIIRDLHSKLSNKTTYYRCHHHLFFSGKRTNVLSFISCGQEKNSTLDSQSIASITFDLSEKKASRRFKQNHCE
jgi:hypothetical protein